ncbi:hypothetical protein SDC9_51606 [bioreactor metagenome]|uniref:Uncharacterized protein n=1 Tax=bioreactor metagenome TaxID=1076179 RepID=A0A644WPB3_9ZZZZ
MNSQAIGTPPWSRRPIRSRNTIFLQVNQHIFKYHIPAHVIIRNPVFAHQSFFVVFLQPIHKRFHPVNTRLGSRTFSIIGRRYKYPVDIRTIGTRLIFIKIHVCLINQLIIRIYQISQVIAVLHPMQRRTETVSTDHYVCDGIHFADTVDGSLCNIEPGRWSRH